MIQKLHWYASIIIAVIFGVVFSYSAGFLYIALSLGYDKDPNNMVRFSTIAAISSFACMNLFIYLAYGLMEDEIRKT